MSPHALDSPSSRKRSAPLDDENGDVVHVKPHPHSDSPNKNSTTTTEKPAATIRADHGIATRSTKQLRQLRPNPMSAVVREGNPAPRVSRAKKGKRVHACTQPGCDKVTLNSRAQREVL